MGLWRDIVSNPDTTVKTCLQRSGTRPAKDIEYHISGLGVHLNEVVSQGRGKGGYPRTDLVKAMSPGARGQFVRVSETIRIDMRYLNGAQQLELLLSK